MSEEEQEEDEDVKEGVGDADKVTEEATESDTVTPTDLPSLFITSFALKGEDLTSVFSQVLSGNKGVTVLQFVVVTSLSCRLPSSSTRTSLNLRVSMLSPSSFKMSSPLTGESSLKKGVFGVRSPLTEDAMDE